MVAKQPVSAEHLLVKWTEFLAEFKTLDNLRPAGQKLNFWQYYSLDAIGFLALTVVFLLLLFFFLFRWIVCKIYRKLTTKKEKIT